MKASQNEYSDKIQSDRPSTAQMSQIKTFRRNNFTNFGEKVL